MSTRELPTFGLFPILSYKKDELAETGCHVAAYNFSTSNMDMASRTHAVNSIASICYETKNKVDSASLYTKLAAESGGLPSSSFEFISVLFTEQEVEIIKNKRKANCINILNIERHGEWVEENDKKYLITNYRAVVYDVENNLSRIWQTLPEEDIRNRFNTKEECDIIFRHTYVFKLTIDSATRVQLLRHRRMSPQERSRRYVSAKRVPFTFYVSEDMKDIKSIQKFKDVNGNEVEIELGIKDVNNLCQEHYFQCLEQGVKAQSARRAIPQGMNTDIWVKFDREGYKNFIELRTDSHAQIEIRELANHMLGFSRHILELQENSN